MPDIEKLNRWIDLAQSSWHKKRGLIFSIILVFGIGTPLLKLINASTIYILLTLLITAIFLIICWFYTNRYPKTPRGKVGFVVCIRCSDEEEEKIIKEDFIETLRSLLKGGKLGDTFHFIEPPKYITETVKDNDDAQILKAKTRSCFIIHGRVRLRRLGGKEHHILDLNGLVAHRAIDKKLSDRLAQEFGELFPKHVSIAAENDLLSFNLTSDWIECVAKYIIGIASLITFDFNYAEQLYRDVGRKLTGLDKEFPIFRKLDERLPIRFSEIYISKALTFLNTWRKSNNNDLIPKLSQSLKEIDPVMDTNYDVLLLRSIEAFLNGRRIDEAISFSKNCRKYDDAVWHFNLAFLYAYNSNLAKTIRQYRKCESYDLPPETITAIEEFMVWILEEEPEKYQYYYCLGFFNWKIKGDLDRAVKDFEKFLEKRKTDEFVKEQALSEKWIDEIGEQSVET